MSVRAKFRVESVRPAAAGEDPVKTIELRAVYEGSEENKKFFAFTPSGFISLSTVNPNASKQFEQGDEFYVDFTKVEK